MGVVNIFGRLMYGLGIAGIILGAMANSPETCFYMGLLLGIGAGLGWE